MTLKEINSYSEPTGAFVARYATLYVSSLHQMKKFESSLFLGKMSVKQHSFPATDLSVNSTSTYSVLAIGQPCAMKM